MAEQETRIEEAVFKLPGIPDPKTIQEPALYRNYFEKVSPKLALGATAWSVIELFATPDVTAEKVGHAVHGNPYLEYQFFEVLNSYKKRETAVEKIEAAIILLGMQNSRNLLIAIQMLRSITGTHPQWTKEGKLQLNPSDVLKYALKTEDLLSGNKEGYSDTAYAAGLLFDVLAMVADTLITDKTEKKKILSYIETVYNHGLASAKIGKEIVKKLPEFGLKKYAFSACLVHDAGKIVMAMLDPDYFSFVEAVGKAGLPRALRHFAEGRRFGIDHTFFGADICQTFRVLKNVDLAILYHHQPQIAKSAGKNISQLASLVCLASNIANQPKRVDKIDDPIFAQWKGPDLKGFAVSNEIIKAAVAAAGA